MTRFFLICSFFLALVSGASFSASASTKKSSTVTVSNIKDKKAGNNSEPVSASNTLPNFPAAKNLPPVQTEQKGNTPKLDELPHIHHFHKERVKKVKRHHKKIWTISMLILVLCHISILILAYMHVAPH